MTQLGHNHRVNFTQEMPAANDVREQQQRTLSDAEQRKTQRAWLHRQEVLSQTSRHSTSFASCRKILESLGQQYKLFIPTDLACCAPLRRIRRRTYDQWPSACGTCLVRCQMISAP